MLKLRPLGPLILVLLLSACSVMPSPDFPREHDVNIRRISATTSANSGACHSSRWLNATIYDADRILIC